MGAKESGIEISVGLNADPFSRDARKLEAEAGEVGRALSKAIGGGIDSSQVTKGISNITQELKKAAAHRLPGGDLMTEDITPVIGAHLGPGAYGFAVISAK